MQHEAIKIILKLLSWRPDLNLMVILVAGLCVIYRAEDIWHHRHLIDLKNTSLVSQANAAPEQRSETPMASEKSSSDNKAVTSTTATAKAGETATTEKKTEFDPLNLDENQVKILKAMAKKEGDTTIADDRAELVKKEEMAKIAESKILDQITQLEEVRKDIKETKDALTKQEQMNVAQMVKIYETMKPEEAAAIFNKLEITALSQIVKAMNPKKAGIIMAAMDEAKVRTVTLVMLEDSQAKFAMKAQQKEKLKEANK
jgi:flagellar motility protein MotE (MotC chaperone)